MFDPKPGDTLYTRGGFELEVLKVDAPGLRPVIAMDKASGSVVRYGRHGCTYHLTDCLISKPTE